MPEFIFNTTKNAPKNPVKIILTSSASFDCGRFCKEETLHELKSAVKEAKFNGAFGKTVSVYDGKNRFILLGTGPKPTQLDIQTLGGKLFKQISRFEQAAVLVRPLPKSGLTSSDVACSLAFGLELGGYRFDKYFTTKSDGDYPALEKVEFYASDGKLDPQDYRNLSAVANAVRYARDLCNEPANYLTPEVFAEDVKRLEYLGLKVEILDEKNLRSLGMNMLLSVAQGSHNLPRVAVIKWNGAPDRKEFDLGLVGKGVTFDSGGISLKPAAGMGDMKGDMTGAAVVAATLKAAALCKVKQNIAGIVGLVENMPSGHATRPGDIVTSMSGQTVEIINTDAEGRLVLGDCLWYLQEKLGPKVIIDIATLTGSTMRTFGFEYAGLFCNTDKMAADLCEKGEKSGEKIWRLPVTKEYDKLIDSDIADVKNCGPANAGGITAACFLQRFVRPQNCWAHLDIAGVDRDDKGHPLTPKGATAFGVRLLTKFIRCW